MAEGKDLLQVLWSGADVLRGKMDANEYKTYLLGLVFYKYLSDSYLSKVYDLLNDAKPESLEEAQTAYEEIMESEDAEELLEELKESLHYTLDPDMTYVSILKDAKNNAFNREKLQAAFNRIEESDELFHGLFADVDLYSNRLGTGDQKQSATIAEVIKVLDDADLIHTEGDVLGNAYEYLIGQFAATAGKKAGEFYTPSGPAELLCRLACLGLTDVKDAADPTCGSGSLLLRLKNYANVRNYYGQELTSTTYNLARMNMILRGIPYRNFNIYNGDTLEHDYFGDMKFRVQVANPPYSANWSADMHFMEDERFNEYGKLAPKSKADFAFVQHMVYHMDEDGRAVVLLPHGVLFRGAAEEVIRKHLIQKLNVLDAVIGLPANLFFGTGIPVCVLVLKRERNGNSDNILFIDASNDFEAGKNQNILRECDIDKIVETYEHRVDVDKYAHVATMQEIEENGFNLNIPRYVDTFEPEEEIDLNAVAAEIRNIQAEIKGIDAQLKPFFDELGLDFPFDVEGK